MRSDNYGEGEGDGRRIDGFVQDGDGFGSYNRNGDAIHRPRWGAGPAGDSEGDGGQLWDDGRQGDGPSALF